MAARGIDDIRALFRESAFDDLADLIAAYTDDPRSGVKTLVRSAAARLQAEQDDVARVQGMMVLQRQLHDAGHMLVAGVDEVGRGALAGPVTAAAVILEADVHIPALDDSKRLTPAQRLTVAAIVRERAIAVSVAHVEPKLIDSLGIVAANALAMRTALDDLDVTADHVIADGLPTQIDMPCTFVVGGDRRCACVAAASVVAKVERDALMRVLDGEFPGYDLALNKGYGTLEHIQSIQSIGPSPVHRLSFSPCCQDRLF